MMIFLILMHVEIIPFNKVHSYDKLWLNIFSATVCFNNYIISKYPASFTKCNCACMSYMQIQLITIIILQ